MKYKIIKAKLFIWNQTRLDKQPFNKKMKHWLTWHKPFEPSYDTNGTSYCPSCGDKNIKENGQGFFKCRNEICKKHFIILKSKESFKN